MRSGPGRILKQKKRG
jgi:hypothetical protein